MEDIEGQYKNRLVNSLKTAFKLTLDNPNPIIWVENIDPIIKEQVEQQAIKYLK